MYSRPLIAVQERTTASPFWLFVLRYVGLCVAFFALTYFEDYSPLIVVSNLHTELSVYLTAQWIDVFDIPVVMSGSSLHFQHGMVLHIVNQCNGLAAMLLFLAAAMAYPAEKKDIVRWSVLAYVLLLVANTIRLCWITYHVVDNPQDFEFVHEVLGRYGFAFVPLILFYFFTRNSVMEKSR